MLDSLLDTVKGEIGLAQVIMRQHQPKIWLAVIEHQQLIKRKFLYPYIDKFLPSLIRRRLPKIIQLRNQIPRDLIYITSHPTLIHILLLFLPNPLQDLILQFLLLTELELILGVAICMVDVVLELESDYD